MVKNPYFAYGVKKFLMFSTLYDNSSSSKVSGISLLGLVVLNIRLY